MGRNLRQDGLEFQVKLVGILGRWVGVPSEVGRNPRQDGLEFQVRLVGILGKMGWSSK